MRQQAAPTARVSVTTIALILFTGCGVSIAAAQAPDASDAGEFIYVTNEDSGTVSVISSLDRQVIETIDVGRRPRGIRVAPDGQNVFVALSGSPKCPPHTNKPECVDPVAEKKYDGIAIVDIDLKRVTRVLPGGSDPEQFDLSSDGKFVYVANEDAGLASMVDVESGEIVKSVSVGGEPEGVRYSSINRLVYVTSETDHVVTVLAADSFDIVATVSVGFRPRDIVVSPKNSKVFVSAEVGASISVIDLDSHGNVTSIALPAGSLPMGVLLSQDESSLFVSNGRGGTVSKIDTDTYEVQTSATLGKRLWGVGMTADGTLYVADGPANQVIVLDSDTLAVEDRIEVGSSPWGIAIGTSDRKGRYQ